MKSLLCILVISLIAGCSNYVSSDEMTTDVRTELQEQLDHDGQFKKYDIQVVDLHLNKMSDGVYEGQSTLAYNGTTYPVSMLVLVTDEGEYIVNIPNDDFAFLDDIELERYRAQLEKEFQDLVGALDVNQIPEPNPTPESMMTPEQELAAAFN